jgi:hypothetical protein
MSKINSIQIIENVWNEDEIDNDLKTFQTYVCGNIEIATRKIGDREFDFILNDEGRIFGLQPSVMFEKTFEDICGNVIITNFDEETGEQASLTSDDIEYIKKHMVVRYVLNEDEEKFYSSDIFCFTEWLV